jgi:hypothetical protein
MVRAERQSAAPPAVFARPIPTGPGAPEGTRPACSAFFMVILDASIVVVVLPSIKEGLGFAAWDLPHNHILCSAAGIGGVRRGYPGLRVRNADGLPARRCDARPHRCPEARRDARGRGLVARSS